MDRNPSDSRDRRPELVFASAAMAAVLDRVRKVAALDTTVLLAGESGTGKELVASWLHEHHPARCDRPLVQIHCGAIPDSLLESELFGHVRGAFTGADRDRAGVFERADGGTLFLDEISTMSAPAQVRLLRVLQERRVTRIGAAESRPVNVRVVVASNENLKRMVEQGTFRLDLYYRINAFPVELPPLRDRSGDVECLTRVFAERLAKRMGLPESKRIGADGLRALVGYPWPGNVRELENAVEHAYILASEREEIELADLPPEIAGLPPADYSIPAGVRLTEDGLSFRTTVSNLERELILQSMRITNGNKARAAELLDLKRTTFLEKLRRLEDDGAFGFALAGPVEHARA